jgi:hypothetical protein
MSILRAWSEITRVWPVLLLTGGLAAVACGTDDVKPTPASDSAGSGAVAGESAQSEGGASGASDGGSPSTNAGESAVAGGGAGGASSATESSSGAGAGGAPSEGGDCYVALSMSTSNAVDVDVPLTERCEAIIFDGQMNFEIYAGTGLNQRNLNIDFFEAPVMGASVDLSKPYDFAAGKGGAASYLDMAGVWNADKGTVTIEKVEGTTFTVRLSDVHFAVQGGGPVEPTSTGEFTANGTITAMSMSGQ